MTEKLYYLTDWSEEIMPCQPSLEAWAEWLSKPDEDWNRPEPAKDGEQFSTSVTSILGEISATYTDGVWVANSTAPEGTEAYYLKHDQGKAGWDADCMGDSIKAAMEYYEPDEGETAWFDCTRDEPHMVATFHAAGPSLTVELAQ